MCYSRCPYENYHGECKGSRFFSRPDAHCNTNFTCSSCGEERKEEEASDFEGVCVECADKYFKCKCCETVYENEDGENGYCWDCIGDGEEVNRDLEKEVQENYLAKNF